MTIKQYFMIACYMIQASNYITADQANMTQASNSQANWNTFLASNGNIPNRSSLSSTNAVKQIKNPKDPLAADFQRYITIGQPGLTAARISEITAAINTYKGLPAGGTTDTPPTAIPAPAFGTNGTSNNQTTAQAAAITLLNQIQSAITTYNTAATQVTGLQTTKLTLITA